MREEVADSQTVVGNVVDLVDEEIETEHELKVVEELLNTRKELDLDVVHHQCKHAMEPT